MPSFIDSDGTVVRNGKRLKARTELLEEAERIVTQDRNKSYGEPDDHFQHVAKIASALGFRIDTGGGEIRELRGSDHTLYMLAVKLSRLMVGDMQHKDSWLDIAGYAACGYETAGLQAKRAGAQQPEPVPAPEKIPDSDLVPTIRFAANSAVAGAPEELEAMGLFLWDDPDVACSKACTGIDHSFRSNCRYSVRRRRVDV